MLYWESHLLSLKPQNSSRSRKLLLLCVAEAMQVLLKRTTIVIAEAQRSGGIAKNSMLAKSISLYCLQGLEVMHSCGLAHLDLHSHSAQVRMLVDGSQLHLTITDLGSVRQESICKLLTQSLPLA